VETDANEKFPTWQLGLLGKNESVLDPALVEELAAVGDGDEDGGLEVEGAAPHAVRVDARRHAVHVQKVEGVLQRKARVRQTHGWRRGEKKLRND
jgi:hypothetical protein